jgi:predicted deacylase
MANFAMREEPLMARSQSRLTAEIDFDRDGKQHGFIRLPYSVHRSAYGWIPIPVACIKNGDGPRVLLMAGNHGDEYEGQVALGKLIRSLEAEEVRGRIIILPSANFPAAMAGSRTSPLDEGNLNRSFPGDPYGGPTAQIANYIESVLLPRVLTITSMHRTLGSSNRWSNWGPKSNRAPLPRSSTRTTRPGANPRPSRSRAREPSSANACPAASSEAIASFT